MQYNLEVRITFILIFLLHQNSTASIELTSNLVHRSQARDGSAGQMMFHLKKRHIHRKGKWARKDLTFTVSKYSHQLDDLATLSELEKAFGLWSSDSDLTFRRVPGGQADIDIRFETGRHKGCSLPFDGPGGALGHAFFPKFGGDVHFDDDERWVVNRTDGVNLIQVAAHAIGHALGLPHSKNPQSVMFPTYMGFTSNCRLHEEDKTAIQVLYGFTESPSND